MAFKPENIIAMLQHVLSHLTWYGDNMFEEKLCVSKPLFIPFALRVDQVPLLNLSLLNNFAVYLLLVLCGN